MVDQKISIIMDLNKKDIFLKKKNISPLKTGINNNPLNKYKYKNILLNLNNESKIKNLFQCLQ